MARQVPLTQLEKQHNHWLIVEPTPGDSPKLVSQAAPEGPQGAAVTLTAEEGTQNAKPLLRGLLTANDRTRNIFRLESLDIEELMTIKTDTSRELDLSEEKSSNISGQTDTSRLFREVMKDLEQHQEDFNSREMSMSDIGEALMLLSHSFSDASFGLYDSVQSEYDDEEMMGKLSMQVDDYVKAPSRSALLSVLRSVKTLCAEQLKQLGPLLSNARIRLTFLILAAVMISRIWSRRQISEGVLDGIFQQITAGMQL